MAENGRELDVVVFGATGVTGRQVAAYLSGTDSRWGAAGRDPAKLERTLADVSAAPTAALGADLSDPGLLAAMAERTAVVLNLVGPYTSRARPVIEACGATPGGTFQSMAEMVPTCLTEPAALIDDPATAQAVRARSPITLRPRTDVRGAVVGPMAPAPFINPAVIHRSAELDARERGVALQPFRYREGFAIAGPSFTLPLRRGRRGLAACRPG